jgi:hypothetical protein
MSIIIEQAGVDCIIIETRRLRICHAQKLKDTMDDKDGDTYTDEEMKGWGFTLRGAE